MNISWVFWCVTTITFSYGDIYTLHITFITKYIGTLVIHLISEVCLPLGATTYLSNFSPLYPGITHYSMSHSKTHMTAMNRIILNFQCQWCEQGADVPADLEQILMNTTGTVSDGKVMQSENVDFCFGLKTC